MPRRRLALAVACVVPLFGACSWEPPPPVQSHVDASLSPAELLGAMSAHQVVDALAREGLPAVNPVDSTAAECPGSGCDQAVVTDAFRILSFPSTGSATNYAAAHQARQVETLAVVFAPNVPVAEQDRYWTAIVNLVR